MPLENSDESEFAFTADVALVEEGSDYQILVVLRLDDVFEVIFVDYAASVFADEAADITAIAAGSSRGSKDCEDEESGVESHEV